MIIKNKIFDLIFLGVDGVGKTTICNYIVKNSNQKMRIAWIRSQHTIAYLISFIFYQLGLTHLFILGGNNEFYLDPRYLNNKSIWSFIEFISVLPLIIKYKIYSSMGYAILYDRSLFDTIIQNRYYLHPHFQKYENILLKLVGNTKCIYLYADFETVKVRKSNLFWPPNFLLFQIDQFNEIAQMLSIPIIDTRNKTVEEIITEISIHL